MAGSSKFLVGLVTCGSRTQARQLAKLLLERRLAACVNLVPGLESHYWWEGRLEKSSEILLLIKTTAAKTAALQRAIQEHHSYELPEIVFLPIQQGEKRYLSWLRGSVAALLVWLVGALGSARADAIDDWISRLGHAEEQTRTEAADKLVEIGGAKAEAQFRKMINSSNPEHRQLGVVGLLKLSDTDEDLAKVRARMQDEVSVVRWTAALSLGRSGWVEAEPWLRALATNDTAESVREIAAEGAERLRNGIAWRRSLSQGLQTGRELAKPVLVYWHVRGSAYCEQLASGVLADKAVINASQEFVCVRLDAVRHSGEARRLDVRGAPTILVLDAEGQELARIAGAVPRDRLLAQLGEIRRGKTNLREVRRVAEREPNNVPANWQLAAAYLADGREDLAERPLRNVIASDAENRYGYTDDALFALGYLLGRREQHAQAVFALERLLERWPKHEDADKALYCLALSRLAVGQRAAARQALEQLVTEHPASAVSTNARQVLAKMGEK